MNKKLAHVLLPAALLFALSACTKRFVEYNTNPNESSAVAPGNLLGPALYKIIATNLNRNIRINNEFMQVTVTTIGTQEFHRYVFRPSETELTWRNWYLELTNIREMYSSAAEQQQPGFRVYQGISLVLDAWVSSLLTDTYGDVPYFVSNQGRSHHNTTPYFDRQIDIYRDIFLKLERANELLNTTEDIESSKAAMDPLFGSEQRKWRKFGNSLYLRLLLRTSHKAELESVAKIQEIVSSPTGYPIMESHDDSAVLYFTGQEPYLNPYTNTRDIDFRASKGYSEFFINNLLALNDPRLPAWASEASVGVYAGMESGYADNSTPERQSEFNLALKTDARLGNIMNHAELQFILAECALRGYTGDDPETLYKDGVRSSMAFWDKTIADSYFDNPAVGFVSTDADADKLKKIHLQKYFSLLFTDFQQWFEYRRTGLLDLYIGTGVKNGGRMPVRLNYPVITQSLNKQHYDEAVQRMGGDGVNERMWWQPIP